MTPLKSIMRRYVWEWLHVFVDKRTSRGLRVSVSERLDFWTVTRARNLLRAWIKESL